MQEVPIVQGFTSGELTPWLSTRFDLQAYQRGAQLIRNFQVLPYGGIRLRPGTNYIGPCAAGDIRLFPFYYAENDALMLEFYPGCMRVYKDGELLKDAAGKVYVLSTPWNTRDELEALHFTQVNDVIYVCCPTQSPVLLSRYSDTEWECRQPDFDHMPRETYNRQEGELSVMFDAEGKGASLSLSGGNQHFLPEMEGKECVLADAPIPARYLFCNEAQMLESVQAPDLSKNSIAKGQLLYQKNTTTSLFYFYQCIRDYTPDQYNGSNNLADYPYSFLPGVMRLDATQQPYEVVRDWELSTMETWSAYWEVWRSYDTPDVEPDFRLWNWTCIKTFSQSLYETRQNWAISGSEEKPCRLVLVCRCTNDADVLGGYLQFKVHGGTREYKFRITEVQDATHARAELMRTYLDNPASFATRSWSFGAIGVRNGYPAFSAMFQGRLWLGGMQGLPTTLLASCTDDFHNFKVGSKDDEALHLRVMGSDQSRICWLCATRQLLIGTSDSEWCVTSGNGMVITPSSVAIRRQSSVGSISQPAQAMENTVLFVQRGGRRLREIAYRLESDGFSATDISMLAEHLFESGVKEWCVQRGANFNVWVLMNDGSLAVLTINLDQQVTAWQRMSTQGRKVLHLVAMPSTSGKDDEVWMVVRSGDVASLHLERMCSDSPHLDACVELVAESDGMLVAPAHLAGGDTRIIDAESGEPMEPGQVRRGKHYYIGIPIVGELQTLPMEGNMSFNSVRQFSRFKLRLLESDTSFEYRSTANPRWEMLQGWLQPELVPPYTGALRLPQMPDAAVGQSLCIRYSGCRDFKLMAITQEVDHHGK